MESWKGYHENKKSISPEEKADAQRYKDKMLIQKLHQIAGLQAEVLNQVKSKEESGESWSVEAFNKLVDTPEVWEDSASRLESLLWGTNTKVV